MMKGASYMPQYNLRMPESVKNELQKHANEQERSMNWILNKIIEEWLKQNRYRLEVAA